METPNIFLSGSSSRRQRKTRKSGRILKSQRRGNRPKSLRYATNNAIIFPQYTTPPFILLESNTEGILYPVRYISEPPLSLSRRLDIEGPAPSPSVNGLGYDGLGSIEFSTSSGTNVGLVAGIVAGLVLVLIVAAIAGCKYWSWRKKRSGRLNDAGQLEAPSNLPQLQDPNSNQGIADHAQVELPPSRFGPRSFSYHQLRLATRNFSSSELLGRGGFGPVYRGTLLDDGSLLAVKCISDDSSQGIKEFQSEVMIISDLRHRNLVKLRGWCAHEDGKLFLVYEYLPKGSLDNLLFNDERCAEALSWSRRFCIILGLGSALQYLHEECDRVIIHRDVKSSNVLLDENFEAKLGDFGLSRQVEQGVFGHSTTVAGTRGYMAPEVFVTGRATKESDVYSFGAVLAEVACGRRPLDPSLAEQTNGTDMLVDWVWDLHSRWRLLEVADERLNGLFDAEQMSRVLTVALACSHPDPQSRPTIKRAMDTLHGIIPLPIIPRSKPIPTYGPAPPMDVQQLLGGSCTTSSHATTAFSCISSVQQLLGGSCTTSSHATTAFSCISSDNLSR